MSRAGFFRTVKDGFRLSGHFSRPVVIHFARYLCDLCNNPGPVSGLRQFVLCGHRACNTSLNEE
jgi:hypothetical protein